MKLGIASSLHHESPLQWAVQLKNLGCKSVVFPLNCNDSKDRINAYAETAKEQGLTLNPTKISGTCGRLMCCLKYEQEAYEHLLRVTPKNGAIVETPEGKGTVIDFNLLTGMLTVTLEKKPDAAPIIINRHQVKVIKDTQIRVDKKELEALKGIE